MINDKSMYIIIFLFICLELCSNISLGLPNSRYRNSERRNGRSSSKVTLEMLESIRNHAIAHRWNRMKTWSFSYLEYTKMINNEAILLCSYPIDQVEFGNKLGAVLEVSPSLLTFLLDYF